MEDNKVKFGLNKVHYAVITGYDSENLPVYATPVRIYGAVSLSLDASGDKSNFFADNGVYYVLNNNSGYEGDLEIAKIPESFEVDVLKSSYDATGCLIESTDTESAEFALLFEFDGDKNHIRHCLYRCSASRPSIEGNTSEDEKEVKTDTLSLTVSPLDNGVVKRKTSTKTIQTAYDNWYQSVTLPASKPEAPVFSPVTGTSFDSTLSVTLTSPTEGATIKYTIGSGTEQTYNNAITLNSSATIYAHTELNGVSSKINMATYTKNS